MSRIIFPSASRPLSLISIRFPAETIYRSLRTYATCPVNFSRLYLIIETRIMKLLLCMFFHFPFYENKQWVGAVMTRLSRIRQVLCFEIGPYFSQFLQADDGIIPLITFNWASPTCRYGILILLKIWI
jgi:hypothetical protein